MAKEIQTFTILADGLVVRTIRVASFDHADYANRESAARAAAELHMQRWHASQQFVGAKLEVQSHV